MPLNTAALKTFAPAMRRKLLEAVGRKLDLLLNSQTPDTLTTYAKQIAELREQEAVNREQLLERVAYTWFNRLCALRYLDARAWHPFGCKVLMPAADGETQPELLKLMRAGNLPADLQSHTDQDRLHGLLDGQIQTAIAGADPQGEVYRELILAVCRSYHQLLPSLFEGLDDASELLLPNDLLSDGSIAGGFRSQISDDDCEDVDILGWLYQFYIAEKKDEVMARKKAVPTEDIPAVTQLFTPHWIVRYLVENSLGRLWLLNRPESKLRAQMTYYIEGESETDFLQITKPEEIKLLDPACGSGHMLTYAFDLLSHIYIEEGYAAAEIPGLILQHNLYGLDICPRAAQLAGLALVLKAREHSRRFFQPGQLVQPQVMELQDVRFEDRELNDYIEALDISELFDPNLFKLLHQFEEAKNFGSLIQPCLDERAIADLRRAIEAKDLSGQLFLRETHLKVLRVLEQADALEKPYSIVAANPPYMSGKMNQSLSEFLADSFFQSRSDLSAVFIDRSRAFCIPSGICAVVAMHSWMFLETLERFRKDLLSRSSIYTLAHFGIGAFPTLNSKVVQTVAFTFLCKAPEATHAPICDRLLDHDSAVKEEQLIRGTQRFRRLRQSVFLDIAGCPIAYWLTTKTIEVLAKSRKVADISEIKSGIMTGNDPEFIRRWHEVGFQKVGIDHRSAEEIISLKKKWFPINRGGDERRWYGNNLFLINLEDMGRDIRSFGQGLNFRLRDKRYYFRQGITWGRIGSGRLSVRFSPHGFIFGDAGTTAYLESESQLFLLLGALLSNSSGVFLQALAPTMNFQVYHIEALPFPCFVGVNKRFVDEIKENAIRAVGVANADWDNFEISWDFGNQPLIRPGLKAVSLEASWRNWEAQSTAAIHRMQELETENNRLFISAYSLQGELQPEVPEEQITLARAEVRKDMAAFLSYVTGCMMGRYSLDKPGLILANAGDTLENYETEVGKSTDGLTFQPDLDGIIPVLDGEWFEDDIVARSLEFLTVTFPETSVTENLRFIEESLGKDIRKYFCSEFYKDHLQTYKKRPIYWMVQSPKKGFSCLIYLHRYTKDTLNQVLNNYFRPYLQKLEARQAQLGLDQLNDDLPARERTAARKEAEKITKVLKECQAWEQDALLPLAQQRIELDLDNGVKVNYLKLQDVLAVIPGLAAKED
ncbi:BREX-1 system adenine-specific DNA-methyltransferase PglX [Synechococcus sp. UW140]|uniref:BREX-1 system adenine-specific DNA-methyltransferase PglX n=1 Tax=Synechococcus sp. UW140 TaxID=368503 RepID=UPI0031381B99